MYKTRINVSYSLDWPFCQRHIRSVIVCERIFGCSVWVDLKRRTTIPSARACSISRLLTILHYSIVLPNPIPLTDIRQQVRAWERNTLSNSMWTESWNNTSVPEKKDKKTNPLAILQYQTISPIHRWNPQKDHCPRRRQPAVTHGDQCQKSTLVWQLEGLGVYQVFVICSTYPPAVDPPSIDSCLTAARTVILTAIYLSFECLRHYIHYFDAATGR